MSNILQEPVDTPTHGVDEPTKQLLREFAASLSHTHSGRLFFLSVGSNIITHTFLFLQLSIVSLKVYRHLYDPNPLISHFDRIRANWPPSDPRIP